MHDTPVRMVAKGVLHGIVPWAQARLFLATRLRRRCSLTKSNRPPQLFSTSTCVHLFVYFSSRGILQPYRS
jgi:hypothetical protein